MSTILSDPDYGEMFDNGNYKRRKRMRRHAYKAPGGFGLKAWPLSAAVGPAAAAAAAAMHGHHAAASAAMSAAALAAAASDQHGFLYGRGGNASAAGSSYLGHYSPHRWAGGNRSRSISCTFSNFLIHTGPRRWSLTSRRPPKCSPRTSRSPWCGPRLAPSLTHSLAHSTSIVIDRRKKRGHCFCLLLAEPAGGRVPFSLWNSLRSLPRAGRVHFSATRWPREERGSSRR